MRSVCSNVMTKSLPTSRGVSLPAVTISAALSLATLVNTAWAAALPEYSSLPDWSGVWARIGTNIFDPATATGGGAGSAGARAHPPYNSIWEMKYLENIEKVKADTFPDPLTYCGIPAGFPRLMSLPDMYEFVVRPEQTWILTENGPNTMRIYTDGRAHMSANERWLTYTGDSVGHWEGNTLIFSTVSFKGEGGTIIDRTGIVLSDEASVVTSIKKVDPEILEAHLVITDPVAFTRPWNVVRRYKKQPRGTRVFDYACAENNRNPVTPDGRTLTLGSDGVPIDKVQ